MPVLSGSREIGAQPVAVAAARELEHLLADLPAYHRLGPDGPVPIRGIAAHSADVRPGWLFACLPGATCDGHEWAAAAVSAGASTLLLEHPATDCPNVTQIVVPDARAALASLARSFWDHPDRHLHVYAVTGTNGKTTTAFMVHAISSAARRPLGLLGTVCYRLGRRELPAPLTTPDAVGLHRMLAEVLQGGAVGVALEASSHALAQKRLQGVEVDTAIFTNLTRDHLDYHGNVMAYFAAKRRLFEPRAGRKPYPALAVICVQGAAGRLLARQAAAHRQVVTFGLETVADVCGRYREVGPQAVLSVSGAWGRGEIRLPLPGRHNAQNALGALAAALANGIPFDVAAHALYTMPPVPGRFEPISAGQDFEVIVDFAHNPDGLRWALATARRRCRGSLIVVFGCKGGDTDNTKRVRMGMIAGRQADMVVLTTDDPHQEDPAAIAAEVGRGLERVGAEHSVVLDRRAAIHHAISLAAPGDVVLVAGRGHETEQARALGAVRLDDRAVCREALLSRAPAAVGAP